MIRANQDLPGQQVAPTLPFVDLHRLPDLDPWNGSKWWDHFFVGTHTLHGVCRVGYEGRERQRQRHREVKREKELYGK